MEFNPMDLYVYLALGGLTFCVVVFGWVMFSLTKHNK